LRFFPCLASLLALAIPQIATARQVVAIIDSGIARTPALSRVLRAEYDETAAPGRTPFVPRYDHGTMVASILNAAAHGEVDIISFRIDGDEACPSGEHPPCQSNAKTIARAIDHASRLRVDAINLSLSLADDPAIVAAVSRATRRGVTVVMAAGNAGRYYPDNLAIARAGYPHAVLVGAMEKDGTPWAGSNGPGPNREGYLYVWQWGVSVPTTDAAGTAVMGTGTSFAAPIETARRLRTAGSPVKAPSTQ
jgi:hypothetical protein